MARPPGALLRHRDGLVQKVSRAETKISATGENVSDLWQLPRPVPVQIPYLLRLAIFHATVRSRPCRRLRSTMLPRFFPQNADWCRWETDPASPRASVEGRRHQTWNKFDQSK